MSDENQTMGADAPASNAAPSASTATASADAPAETDGGWRNQAEIKAALKKVRDLEAKVEALTGSAGRSAPPAPTDLAAEFTKLRAESEIKDCLNDMGIAATREQRAIVNKLFQVDRPSDVASWLRETIPTLNLKSAPPVAQGGAPIRTDLGAPAREETVLSRDSRMIPPSDWRALPSEERIARHNETLRNQHGGNPFHKPLPGRKA